MENVWKVSKIKEGSESESDRGSANDVCRMMICFSDSCGCDPKSEESGRQGKNEDGRAEVDAVRFECFRNFFLSRFRCAEAAEGSVTECRCRQR